MSYVLVVDDDDDIRDVIAELLESEGFVTHKAEDGAAALEVIAARGRPCLIVLDVMMPRMDAYEFRERQLADPSLADVPVLVATAAKHLDCERLGVPADRCMRKPFGVTALLDAVGRSCPVPY